MFWMNCVVKSYNLHFVNIRVYVNIFLLLKLEKYIIVITFSLEKLALSNEKLGARLNQFISYFHVSTFFYYVQ